MLSNLLSRWMMNTITQKRNVIYEMINNSRSDTEKYVQA